MSDSLVHAVALPTPLPATSARLAAWQARWLLPLQILLVAGGLAAGVWLQTLHTIAQDRAQAIMERQADMGNLGQLSAEHVGHTLESVDLSLRMVRQQMLEHDGHYALQSLFADNLVDKRLVVQLDVLDARGFLLASNLPFKSAVNVSNQDYFKAHRATQADILYISASLLGAASGQWTILFSRRISRSDGSLFGVVVASVDPAYFTRFYGGLALGGNGASSLATLDGGILARTVEGTDQFQGQLPFPEMLSRLAAGASQGSYVMAADSAADARLVHFRRLPEFQLVVAFSQPLAQALEVLQASRQTLLRQAGVVTLLLALGALLFWKRRMAHVHVQALAALRLQDEAALAMERQQRGQAKAAEDAWMRLQSAALEACANAMYIADVSGVILWANLAFARLSGYTLPEILGSRPQDLAKSGVQGRQFYDHLWQTVLSGKPWEGQLVNRRKDGQLYHEQMSITPVTDAQARVTHFIVVKDDITQHQQTVADANAANLAKSQFLANMSHEIRTPMNGVVGMVDILQATELNPAQRRMLATVHKSALSLLSILNDILDYSKIESGMLTVERIPMHVRDVIESAVQLMAVAAGAVQVEMLVFVVPDLPPWIVSDPTRLRQVLLNLLGNAIKFIREREDGVAARVTLLAQPCVLASGAAGMQICVADNGMGMSAQLLGALFQPFTQADASTARRFGGTGLGLSICQRLVTLMGGRISVQSTPGVGSEFCIELPLQAATPPRMPVFGPQLQGVQVLVLVADAYVRQSVEAYAAETLASVLPLSTLEQVHALPAPTGPAVLVLGPEHALCALQLPAGLGLVRLSQFLAGQDAGNELTVAGMPLIFNDFARALALASRRLTPSPTLEQRAPGLPCVPLAPSVELAVQQQLLLLADDNEVNRTVIQEQLRLLGYASEMAEDGQIALQMWRSGRYALLLTDCHMPNMDGFELTEAIRSAEPAGTRLPIVAITANAMPGEAQRCMARGMDDYLSKPLRMLELAPMLQKWLPPSCAAERAMPSAPLPIALPAALMPVWDVDMLGQMVGDDPALQQRLLDMFLRNAEGQIAAICLSTSMGRVHEAADQAHSLKSAARMVGAMAFGALCEEIECAGLAADAALCHALAQGLDAQLALMQAAMQADASACRDATTDNRE